MGWNDWNSYGCGVSENAVTNTAAIMAANGMEAAGYQYVNVDDCWATSARDSNGVVVVNASKFPRGFKAVADFVHSKGLKFGLYTDHGTNTCSGSNPVGSYGYEYLDAMTYAQFGADYLKNDSCKLPVGDVPYDDYFRMADGLMKSGRQIFNSLCPNAAHYEYWSPDVGNSWRTTGDIHASFSSMLGRIDPNSKSAYLAGPGRWNDPDMLEVGNGEFATNFVAAQTHFTMWCIMAAPLVAGNNITTMSAQTLQILTNTEAIAVDQDPAGEQGVRVGGSVASGEVWSKPLGYDFTTRAVVLLNRSTNAPTNITCYWTNLALQPGSATVRDLWSHADLGTFTGSFSATIPPFGSMLLKIVGTPVSPPPPGTNYLSDLQPIYAYTGFGTLTKDKSINGNTLTLAGNTYSKGIGTYAIGGNEFNLGGVCSRFVSDIGVDDEVGSNGSVIFQVFADGTKIYDSGIMTGGTATKTVDLDVTGVRRLTIGVTDTGNDVTGNRNSNDHADWAGARVIVTNTTPQVPRAPTGLIATGGNQITLAWAPTLAAINYNVKRATSSGAPYTTITNVPLATFTDGSVTVGSNYFYVVSAVSSFGEGSNSLQAAVTACNSPAMPTNVTATASNSAIVVRWNPVSGATSYKVARFTSSTPPVTIGTVTSTNFTDTNIVGGTIYFYLVAAGNACGQSAFSAFVPGTVSGPPAAPGGLTASPGDSKVTLAWNGSADSFNVKRSLTDGGPYAVIATNVLTGTFLDSPLTNGTTYYYVVSGVNAVGESADSAQASATPNTNFNGGLVAWLNFDDGTASDASGYGNSGTLVNAATIITDPQRGKVLALDGTSAYVDLGASATLDLSGDNQATIAAWVKPAVTKSHNSIITKGEWKDCYSLLIKGDTSPANLLWTGNDTPVFSGAAVPLGAWTHVAVTINSNLATFYINGQVSGAANQDRGGPIDNTTNHVCIGREQYSGSLPTGRWFFNGLIDDVRIYRQALTQPEIQSIMYPPWATPARISLVGMNGSNLILGGTNGMPGGMYYVLASTNLALPLSDWVPIATNFCDGNGVFSFTNPAPAGPVQFYMLQVP
jgi:alpha-galactosidase